MRATCIPAATARAYVSSSKRVFPIPAGPATTSAPPRCARVDARNESIRRNASQILNRRLKSSLSEGKLFSSLLEAKQFAGALPGRLNKILDAMGNAELNVKVKPAETQFLLEGFQEQQHVIARSAQVPEPRPRNRQQQQDHTDNLQ